MKAAVTTEQHGFDVVELPDPTPGSGELVVRVSGCGVCGSDVKAQPYAPAGMVMGHEFGGEVVSVGPDVDVRRLGTNVAVLPIVSCGRCTHCTSGAVAHCGQTQYIGMGPAGGFAEYATVPARHAFELPADVPPAHSALVEPFAVGLQGVHRAGLVPGQDVLIVGAGGVGLTTLTWALRKGGNRVTVADPDPDRLRAANALGATDVLASVTDADASGYDVVVECVGRPELVQFCQPALRPLGTLVVSGACSEPTPVEPVTALLKEVSIRYSVAYTVDEFREVVSAFADGTVDPTATAGPSYELDRIGAAFDAVRGAGARGRVSVVPG